MAGRRKEVLDIREIIRRCRLGEADRQIARDLSTGRNTVAWYREWAKREGLLDSAELPDAAYIQKRFQATIPPAPPGPSSPLERFHDYIVAKRQIGVELVALHRLLKDEKDYDGSYSSLRRYVEKLEADDHLEDGTFTRVETDPGEEAQVDFGYAGMIFDKIQKRLRKAWVFVMKLCFSRHQYDEIVFDQTVGTWCALHARAFEFFGGVVKRVKVDNLKAAITKAVMHDPEANRTYHECAEHYDFAISPCKPKTPRHKGKVEKGGVHYVKRNALAGRTFPGKEEANEYLLWWTKNVAGRRDHGTIHEAPLRRFEERERQALKPLPATRYEPSTWKQVKVHSDCHVVFEYNYYSAPFRLARQELWLRATPERVEIYHHHERIVTHPRAAGKGQRVTIKDHYPPEKIQGTLT
ncbi:MAG: IS21 family transposase, partial [Bacillota bacterium]